MVFPQSCPMGSPRTTFPTLSPAAEDEQWRVGAVHLILIRHVHEIQRAETCPCSQTSPAPPERLEQTAGPQLTPWHICNTHTSPDHAIRTTNRGHAAALRTEGGLLLLPGNALRAATNMKRKSERRRAESRKKRCAALSSSEAEPTSDVYTEITGKGPAGWTHRVNPVNLRPTLQIWHGRPQQDACN